MPRNKPTLSREKAEQILAEVVEHHEDAVQQFWGRMTSFTTTEAFYRGKQHGNIGPRGYVPHSPSLYESREVHNYCRAFVEAAVSDMLKNPPSPLVSSAHADPEAMMKARLATSMALSFLRTDVFPFDAQRRAAYAATKHGASFLKIAWDPGAGRRQRVGIRFAQDAIDPEQWSPELDELGDEINDWEAEGDIRVQARNLGEVLPDPTAKNFLDARYCVELISMPITDAQDLFPADFFGGEIKWNTNEQSNLAARQALEAADPFDSEGHYSSHRLNETVEIINYCAKPDGRFGRGLQVMLHGKQMLHIDRLPDDVFPFRLVDGQFLTEDMFADGVLRDQIGPQKSINRAASKQKEILDKAATDFLLEPRGANIRLNEMSDISGFILTHNYGFKPEWIKRPPVDPSMTAYRNDLVRTMKETSTYSDVSMGETTHRRASGRAIAYEAETQRGVHAPHVHATKLAILGTLEDCLRIAGKRYTDNRLIEMYGPNGAWGTYMLRKDEVDWGVKFHIEYNGGHDSQALRFDQSMEALTSGGLSDTPEGERFRRLNNWEHLAASTHDTEEVDRASAQAENAMFLNDPLGLPKAEAWEDHDIHLDVHIEFMKSMRFKQMAPEVQQYMIAHVQSTEEMLAAQKEQFAYEAQMLEGGGPPMEEGGEQLALPAPGTRESPMAGGHQTYPGAAPTPPEMVAADQGGPAQVPSGFVG